ncbi:C4-dicarboxylate ABC transporter substrate-binding protein [Billgrantia tianxiuensis]|uniref:C4-dicarboxylate ABC transporter substrate-binding protein n=2 Tax=Oceanospirillales TaxID=135619 RepID=A0A6I6SRJ5_9GAMM|nr:TRAP transporter substrate-binding protein DctP [Halomonas sp. MCCC 1A11057]QHC52001.1 C4-dicarboxylate ABC transporter substrate-binding protein [Halomonas tianxiuensis]
MVTESGDRESPQGMAVKRISDLVAEQSDGRITINVFYQGEIGGPQELFDQLVMGNIDLFLGWPQTSYDERLGVLQLPYLTLGWEEALEAYGKDGWVSEVIGPILSDIGLEYLGPFPEGFGGIATRNTYATSYEDARGIKLRSQPIFPLPQTIQAMGFQAVPIDWSEVYTSIQTGVVDGDSSNVIYWDYTYFNDLLDYFVHSKHNFSFYTFLMNQDSWNELDEEDRGIIANAVEIVANEQFTNARAEDEKWIQKAQEDGMEYIVPSDEEMAAWVERVRETVWVEAEKSLGEDVMAAVREHASEPN